VSTGACVDRQREIQKRLLVKRELNREQDREENRELNRESANPYASLPCAAFWAA
jgi:hypothetical protein